MNHRSEKADQLEKKYTKAYYAATNQLKARGIFTQDKRKKMFGKGGYSRLENKTQCWYKVRRAVKAALVDLRLFIEVADDNNANQVLTLATLSPLIDSLLSNNAVVDSTRAKIAQYFVEKGFTYLSIKMRTTSAFIRTISTEQSP